ncbi:MAG: L-glutamate gamma-semialdehyde dehydrogenase [Deltaproteobacteria bacterium]|nr:L-glutamate gamma-semialdehyde dehydrogenase [Myxococcales bacterium]MDP3220684.1 L-glutamate gamma-semialdehyde dehydrogenase [Deltaproteobacteria bacterium]
MIESSIEVPAAVNEPVRTYAPGSAERAELERALATMAAAPIEVPAYIGGRDVPSAERVPMRSPHRHDLVLGHWHSGGPSQMDDAVAAALAAAPAWAATPWSARAAIFLKAAELLATKHRATLNAATMLGQSKTAHQAEIDAACELVDFWRFNVAFLPKILADQPLSSPGVWNLLDHRPLEGFVLAVTPFNFTAIAGNLPTAPALMGNVVVWKPSATAMYSAHFILEILKEAGLPPGVINMVLGDPAAMVDRALASRHLAGVHFTGSTAVFRSIWAKVGAGVGAGRYRSYPRVVGETGGKDFVFAHPSADVDALAVALVRGAYEYQGQKCSAASRAYVPSSLWASLRARLLDVLPTITVGDVSDFAHFMGAVIDRRAYDRITGAVRGALADPGCEVLHHGHDDHAGYFIRPTLIRVADPGHALMHDELFGPVLAVFVYDDARYEDVLARCANDSEYALTGAFWARDRGAITHASGVLRQGAGNFYVNDKPTGAVVGQQPFGGARASGTNDKAGSALNLLRWVSPRTVKETLVPPTEWRYPSMG